MRTIILIIHLAPLIIIGQIGFSLDATPNLVFQNYDGDGVIPAGFFLKKNNLSFSGGVSIYGHLSKSLIVRVGHNYFINEYRSVYHIDSKQPKGVFDRVTLQTRFFEPKLSFSYNLHLRKKKNPILFIELGIGLSISNSIHVTFISTFNQENFVETTSINSLITTTTIFPIENSPLKFYFSVGRTIDIFNEKVNNLSLDIILSYRNSQNEDLITRTFFIDNEQFYSFNYFRNSSYLGLTLRLNYSLVKQRKAHNKT